MNLVKSALLVVILGACDSPDEMELRGLTHDGSCNLAIAAADLFQDAPDRIQLDDPRDADALCQLWTQGNVCEMNKNKTVETCCEDGSSSSGPRGCCSLTVTGRVDCFVAKY